MSRSSSSSIRESIEDGSYDVREIVFVSESVSQHLLGAGVVFAEIVVGVLLFPLCLEELTVEVIAGLGLTQVDGLLSLWALIFFHFLVTELTGHAILHMHVYSY